jgi:hypothetical protein
MQQAVQAVGARFAQGVQGPPGDTHVPRSAQSFWMLQPIGKGFSRCVHDADIAHSVRIFFYLLPRTFFLSALRTPAPMILRSLLLMYENAQGKLCTWGRTASRAPVTMILRSLLLVNENPRGGLCI